MTECGCEYTPPVGFTNGPNVTRVVFSEFAGIGRNDFANGTMFLGVPEPGTLVLLRTGFIVLAGVVRRRCMN